MKKYTKTTRGRRIAADARRRMNSMSPEQRKEHFRKGMKMLVEKARRLARQWKKRMTKTPRKKI